VAPRFGIILDVGAHWLGSVFHVEHSGFGPTDFAVATGVSRETLRRLEVFVEMLAEWNARVNLVSEASLLHVWHRHILDCAQLFPLIPKTARVVLDLGSGAGFPGMVLALMGVQGLCLVESRGKKIQFLNAVAVATDTEVNVFNGRIEALRNISADVIIARALAPLDQLLGYGEGLCAPNAIQLYLKGQSFEDELTRAKQSWNMDVELYKSQTNSECSIIKIHNFSRV